MKEGESSGELVSTELKASGLIDLGRVALVGRLSTFPLAATSTRQREVNKLKSVKKTVSQKDQNKLIAVPKSKQENSEASVLGKIPVPNTGCSVRRFNHCFRGAWASEMNKKM